MESAQIVKQFISEKGKANFEQIARHLHSQHGEYDVVAAAGAAYLGTVNLLSTGEITASKRYVYKTK